MRTMIGSFYSKKLFPHLCEFALSGNFLNRFRQETLQETRGKVLEIGFGGGQLAYEIIKRGNYYNKDR